MKLELKLTKDEIAERYAKDLGIDPNSITLVIEDEPVVESTPLAPSKEPEPLVIRQNFVFADEKPKMKFLKAKLKSLGFEVAEAATLCGVSRSCINRACAGYWLRPRTVYKIAKGLELTEEELVAFKGDMTKHQDH